MSKDLEEVKESIVSKKKTDPRQKEQPYKSQRESRPPMTTKQNRS